MQKIEETIFRLSLEPACNETHARTQKGKKNLDRRGPNNGPERTEERRLPEMRMRFSVQKPRMGLCNRAKMSYN